MMLPRTAVRPCGPISLAAVLIALSLLFPVQTRHFAGVSELAAQEPTMRIETQTLMRRLAEALDGHRTGRQAYVVAKRDYPHNVYGVFDTVEDARRAVGSVRTSPEIFGPFLTIRDPFGPVGCVHRGPSDMLGAIAKVIVPPGLPVSPVSGSPVLAGSPVSAGAPVSPGSPAPPDSLPPRYCPDLAGGQFDSITVAVHLHGGQQIVLRLPADADALFLTASALDKFAMPYYTRLYGADSAAAMRRELLRRQ